MTKCDSQYYDYPLRLYVNCKLEKNHKGKHQATINYIWTNEQEAKF